MLYAETDRLILRALEKSDLPRIVELLSEREVARWLPSVPCPYDLSHAEEFYQRMKLTAEKGKPEYFLLQRKSDGSQIGAIRLHAPREPFPSPGELVIGYWLGSGEWGQGLMSEAVKPVIDIAFSRAEVALITASTDPVNEASQKVLRKSGFAHIGTLTPQEGGIVMQWQLMREANGKRGSF